MKSIIITENSGWKNLKIKETSFPAIKSDQVLVKIKASGINPIDWKAPEYNLFEYLNMKLPYIIGSDISGVIEAMGSNVKNFNIGDEVFGALELISQGAFAEYAVIEEKLISHKPKNLTFIEAASVPLSSLTAWQGLFEKLELQEGQKILIQAAAGGVGIFAVQLAKQKGAYVVAVGSEKNEAFLKSLGANEVFSYKNDYSNLPKDFDAVFDSMESSKQTIPLLKKGGKYLSITEPASEELINRYGILATNFLYKSDGKQLSHIKDLLESNNLKTFIDSIFPLSEASEALKYQKQGHSKGKNVLVIS
ncbi:MAG: NADP-dependent oxidoreductase [Sphingobacteriales bacterium]|nr:NADP-dependent oxidoreductase [Sphingobacteriales bacterium]